MSIFVWLLKEMALVWRTKREGGMWEDASSQRSDLVDFSTDGYFFKVYVSASFCLMKITFAITQHVKVEKYISDLFPWTSIFAWLLQKKTDSVKDEKRRSQKYSQQTCRNLQSSKLSGAVIAMDLFHCRDFTIYCWIIRSITFIISETIIDVVS